MRTFEAYLDELTVGSHTSTGGWSRPTIDARGADRVTLDVLGLVKIGYGRMTEGEVYLQNGTGRAADLELGLYYNPNYNKSNLGYLWLSNLVFTVTNTVTIGQTGDLVVYVDGQSAGLDIETGSLNVETGDVGGVNWYGTIDLNFVSDSTNNNVDMWGLRIDGDQRELYKIGILAPDGDLEQESTPLLAVRHLRFIPVGDLESAIAKVKRHQLDLLLDPREGPRYWINTHSSKGYIAERLLVSAYAESGPSPQRHPVSGRGLRYVDWVLPGVLAMNIMFSSLWGVGWVIVRYRKNGVLRRLQATPLSAFEFLSAQVLSRLAVVLTASVIVYIGADSFLDFVMRGSYLALFLVYLSGALCLISLGLIVAARLRTEELADGVLNVMSWPMLLLSGVWFSMEGVSPAAQAISKLLPLTYVVDAARRVMVDGAGVVQVLPEIAVLLITSLLLLSLAARLFRWD
jgi:ABC-type multidrug transport system permease subunit